MSAAKTCLAGLVLFSLTAAACTSDDAAEARARAEGAEARVETLGADLAEAEIALAEVQADLAAAIETADQLAENLAALQADLREKELLLQAHGRELSTLQEQHQTALGDLAALQELYHQMEARVGFECPIPTQGLPVQALPAPVAEIRARIHAAAGACDWLELHRLAEEAGGIEYADGAVGWHGDPVPWWLTNPGELRLLAGILELSFGVLESQDAAGNPVTYYVWPAARVHDPITDADWAELRHVYSAEFLAEMREWGTGYAGGFTVWISETGVWQGALRVSA